jgi:hypothetical protein
VTIADTPMPAGVAALPRDKVGYPIPWSVATLPDGTRDFRVIDGAKFEDAILFQICWICGNPLGRYGTFNISVMSTVSQLAAEPPSHQACAEYAARVCPFLANPGMRFRGDGLPDGCAAIAGTLLRNPIVTVLWSSWTWRPVMTFEGIVFDIGDNAGIQWFTRGRLATREEVVAIMNIEIAELRKEGLGAVCDFDERAARVADLFPV